MVPFENHLSFSIIVDYRNNGNSQATSIIAYSQQISSDHAERIDGRRRRWRHLQVRVDLSSRNQHEEFPSTFFNFQS